MAVLFAIFGVFATSEQENLVPVNAISDSINHVFAVNPWVTGVKYHSHGHCSSRWRYSIGTVAGVLVT